MKEGVGKDINVDIFGTLYLVAATATAVFRVLGVVEAIGGEEEEETVSLLIGFQPGSFGATKAFAGCQGVYFVDGMEKRMVEVEAGEGFSGEQVGKLLSEGAYPLGIGTACGGQQKAAVREVVPELDTLFFGQSKTSLSAHNGKGIVGEVTAIEAYLAKMRFRLDFGLGLEPEQKAVTKALGGLVPRIDKIGALYPCAVS